MIATPENTSVVSILAYERKQDVPSTAGFMQQSAKTQGINLISFMRGERYEYNTIEIDNSFEMKLTRLKPKIDSLPESVKFILYVDARDCIFVRSLQSICDEFNAIGWPMLISGSSMCAHHIDPAWAARFGKHASGFDYINAGAWMANRESFNVAYARMVALSKLVKEDRIASSHPPLYSNDQHMWQVAYVEHAFPLRVDFEQRVFNHFSNTPFNEYDFTKSRDDAPVVLKSGSRPCVIHFPGRMTQAMPFVAWLVGAVKAPETPEIDWE